ncbi:MAG: type II/IV secretion system protein [Acidobacteria bacterium]|nr:type II/IV secretion system protein [Acidobacteriota bacterium]
MFSGITSLDIPLRQLFSERLCRRLQIVPLERQDGVVRVGTDQPENLALADELRIVTGCKIELERVESAGIEEGILSLFPPQSSPEPSGSDPLLPGSEGDILALIDGVLDQVEWIQQEEEDFAPAQVDAPIIQLVNGILVNAVRLSASDIHFEPGEKAMAVRYRLDGLLQRIVQLPAKVKNSVLARIKVMASMDLAEKRVPQDGRIRLKINRVKAVDFRVSLIPTPFGEKAVLRVLDRSHLHLVLDELGHSKSMLGDFRTALALPWGLILVTGPTGSGKTTTLYAALRELDREHLNIVTVEDPIEYQLPGISQVQTHEKVGLTFARSLRAFLRQDPDVILVGETRDAETADIAVKASLTGHLVLTTLHCNDAWGALPRLQQLGISPALLGLTLRLSMSQRLVRRLCPHCKIYVSEPHEQVGFQAVGCSFCHQGYRGRTALSEAVRVDESLAHAIAQAEYLAPSSGGLAAFRTLFEHGLEKVKQGETDWAELRRIGLRSSA